MAGTRIIALPFASDQPVIAAFQMFLNLSLFDRPSKLSVVDQTHRCGLQLYQLSSGLEGLTLGNGILVQTKEDAIQAELPQCARKDES